MREKGEGSLPVFNIIRTLRYKKEEVNTGSILRFLARCIVNSVLCYIR